MKKSDVPVTASENEFRRPTLSRAGDENAEEDILEEQRKFIFSQRKGTQQETSSGVAKPSAHVSRSSYNKYPSKDYYHKQILKKNRTTNEVLKEWRENYEKESDEIISAQKHDKETLESNSTSSDGIKKFTIAEPSSTGLVTEIREKTFDDEKMRAFLKSVQSESAPKQSFPQMPPPKAFAPPTTVAASKIPEQKAPSHFFQEISSGKEDLNEPDYEAEKTDIITIKNEVASENDRKLRTMTEEEILQAQTEIMKHIKDPKLLKFMADRNAKATTVVSQTTKINSSTKPESGEHKKLPQNIPDSIAEVSQESLHESLSETTKDHTIKWEWMQSLPNNSESSGDTRVKARFDFNGRLLPQEAPISETEGLHHHGDDPEKAGYTIDELLILSRSEVPSQRVVGLKIISKVIAYSKQGIYDKAVSPSILKSFVENDSGAIVIVLSSLFLNHAGAYTAALSVLDALLCSPSDERALDDSFNWTESHQQPILSTDFHSTVGTVEDGPQRESLLKDDELFRQDVVRGLIRCHLLDRFFYLLDIIPVSAKPGCIQRIISILIRIGRHSLFASECIVASGLLSQLKDSYFPLTIPEATETEATVVLPKEGLPYPAFIKLIRVLSVHETLAEAMVKNGNVRQLITRYIIEDPSTLRCLSPNDSAEAVLEVYRLWIVLIISGQCHDLIGDMFPTILSHIQTGLLADLEGADGFFMLDRTGLAVTLVEAALTTGKSKSESYWKPLIGLYSPVETVFCGILSKSLSLISEASRFDDMFHEIFNGCVLSLARCLSVFLSITDGLKISDSLVPVLKNFSQKGIPHILRKLEDQNYSVFLNSIDYSSSWERDPSSLPSLRSTSPNGLDLFPTIRKATPYPFLAAWIHLATTVYDSQPSLGNDVGTNSALLGYIQSVRPRLTDQLALEQFWFTKIETEFLHRLGILGLKIGQGPVTEFGKFLGKQQYVQELGKQFDDVMGSVMK